MNKLHKIIFIITLFIFTIGMCCIACMPDNDLWARLIVGKHILENLSILKQDFYSYTPTHYWYDHEWGSSFIFYTILKYFGVKGLIFLKGILCGLILFIAYKTIELRKPESTTPFNILYFVIMFLAFKDNLGLIIRCLMFTCLFFALFVYILEKARNGKYKSLIWLPIITIFWANLHGGCLSGIGLIALYAIGEFLNKKPFLPFLYSFFGSLFTTFINPYGWEYVKFLFAAGLMDRKEIAEWNSSFDSVYIKSFIAYKLYLAAAFITAISSTFLKKLKLKDLDKTKIIITVFLAYLSITHVRHQFFFVYYAGVLWYDEFYSLFNSLINIICEKFNIGKETRDNTVIIKEMAVYFLLFLAVFTPLTNKKEIRITETEYPRFAVEFIDINKIKGNLLVNFNHASYCAYKLFPQNRIFMDGRYEEVYNPKLLTELIDFYDLKINADEFLDKYKTDIIILEQKFPVYDKMLENNNWRFVFGNNLSGVFVRANKAQNNYQYPIPYDEYYNDNLFQNHMK
ncbi:hypothetical protein II906_13325 [bacterium]|nr:hypothetical protein [bacterium]